MRITKTFAPTTNMSNKTFAPTTNMSNKTFSRFNKFPIPPANLVVLEQKTQSCDVLGTLGMCRLIVVFDS